MAGKTARAQTCKRVEKSACVREVDCEHSGIGRTTIGLGPVHPSRDNGWFFTLFVDSNTAQRTLNLTFLDPEFVIAYRIHARRHARLSPLASRHAFVVVERLRLATLKEQKLSSGTMSTVHVEGVDLVMVQVPRAVHGPLPLLSVNNSNKIAFGRLSWVVPLTTFQMTLFSYQ